MIERVIDGALEATVVASFSRVGIKVRERIGNWTAVADLPGDGRTVLVTGANSGLGLAAATQLAVAGARVLAVVRDDEKGQRTADHVRLMAPDAEFQWWVANLLDLSAVDRLGREIAAVEPRLDAVVHNAGAMFPTPELTAAGIERTFALHVVAPHVLTRRLLDPLTAAGGRVIWVSSGGMYSEGLDVDRLMTFDDYRPARTYARAKRAQVVLAAEWQRRVGDANGIVFHAMHPGWALTPGVETSLPTFRRIMGPLLRSPDEGADTITWLALSPEAGHGGGRFWLDRRPRSVVRLPGTSASQAEAQRLWKLVSRFED